MAPASDDAAAGGPVGDPTSDSPGQPPSGQPSPDQSSPDQSAPSSAPWLQGSRPQEAVGLLLLAAVAAAALFGGAVRVETFTYVAALVACAGCLWLGWAALRGELSLVRRPADLLAVVFVLVAGLSAAGSVNPYSSRLELHRFATYAVFFFLCGQVLTSKRDLRRACVGLLVVGTLIAVAGLAGLQATAPGGAVKVTPRLTSAFVNPNHFASLVTMTALLGLGLVLAVAGGKRVLVGGLVAYGVVAIAWSGSRGAAVAAVAGGLVLVVGLVAGGRVRQAVPVAMVAVAALGLALAVVPARLQDRIASAVDLESGAGRLELWRASLTLIGQRPWLGSGPGTFREVFGEVQPDSKARFQVTHAHNEYVELATESGLLSVAIAGLSLLLLGWRWIGLTRRTPDDIQAIGFGAIGATAAGFVHALVEFLLRSPANALLFLASASIALASARATWRGGLRWRWALGWPGRVAVLVVAASTLWLGAAELGPPWRAAVELEGAALSLAAGQTEAGLRQLQSALAFNPRDPAIRDQMAEAELLLGIDPERPDEVRQAHLERALSWIDGALDRAPSHPEYHRRRARVLDVLGRPAAAEAALVRAVQLRPSDPGFQAELGFLYLGRGQREPGLLHLRRAIGLDPRRYLLAAIDQLGSSVASELVGDDPVARRILANYLRLRDERRAASDALGLVHDAEPTADNALAHLREMAVLPDPGDGPTALRYVAIYPQTADVVSAAARVLCQLNESAACVGLHRRLVKVDPSTQSRVALALAQRDAEVPLPEIRATLRQAIAADPHAHQAWFQLGLAARIAGDAGLAMECFEKAVTLAPSHAPYRLRLGQELLARADPGDTERARDELKRCLDLDPMNEWCARSLRQQPEDGP